MELLTLRLSAIDEAYFRVIARSQAGEAEADSRLPFFESGDRWRTTLIKALAVNEFRSSDFGREGEQDWMIAQGWLSPDRQNFHPVMLARIGQAMYEALFPVGKVRDVLQRAIARAEDKGVQLHIQLEFTAEVTQCSRLPDYPWELASPDGATFLAHHQVRFSRYIAHLTTVPSLPPIEQLNVLLVSSGAFDESNGLHPLSRKEQNAVFKGLEKAQADGHMQVAVLEAGTLSELRIYLTEHQGMQAPHIVHFDGHGAFGKRCNGLSCRTFHKELRLEVCQACGAVLPEPQGYLLFEPDEDDQNVNYVSAIELGELLQKVRFGSDSIRQRGITVAVLSACKSGMSLGSTSVFNGVAQRLISHQIPAVVAIQYTVRVDSATRFTEQFYRSLGRKNSLALAVSQGKEAMGAEGNQWYRPVLYLRWQDNEGGQLFVNSLPSSVAPVQTPTPIPENQGFAEKSKLSRFQKLELERFKRELTVLVRDYETVSNQLRLEGDGPRQNQLTDQLEQLGRDMEQREQQIYELEHGDDV